DCSYSALKVLKSFCFNISSGAGDQSVAMSPFSSLGFLIDNTPSVRTTILRPPEASVSEGQFRVFIFTHILWKLVVTSNGIRPPLSDPVFPLLATVSTGRE